MKITENQIKETMKKMPEGITEEYVQKIVEPFPEETPYALVEGPLIVSVRREQGKAKPEEVTKEIKTQLMAKRKSAQGENAGSTKTITRAYFDHLLVEQRLIGSVIPDTKTTIFNQELDTPVMTAALSHLGKFNADLPGGMYDYAGSARMNSTLHFVGMCENDEFADIMKAGAKTVRIIKPYKEEEKIYDQITFAKEAGAAAVGMDIDHIFTRNGDEDITMGEQMEAKTMEQFRNYVEKAGIPFVIKGVLSETDALKALEVGAAGIVVSHHGGRIDYAVPPLYVLPKIAAAVKGKLTIFVDCGVQSGADAYKALALGADGVCIGTHLIPYLKKGGAEGCAKRMDEITKELKGIMAFTGVKDTKSFDPSVIHEKNW